MCDTHLVCHVITSAHDYREKERRETKEVSLLEGG